jgi:hypothetical protein
MNSRYQDPALSYSARLDWSNPLLYGFVGFLGSILAAVVLVLV